MKQRTKLVLVVIASIVVGIAIILGVVLHRGKNPEATVQRSTKAVSETPFKGDIYLYNYGTKTYHGIGNPYKGEIFEALSMTPFKVVQLDQGVPNKMRIQSTNGLQLYLKNRMGDNGAQKYPQTIWNDGGDTWSANEGSMGSTVTTDVTVKSGDDYKQEKWYLVPESGDCATGRTGLCARPLKDIEHKDNMHWGFFTTSQVVAGLQGYFAQDNDQMVLFTLLRRYVNNKIKNASMDEFKKLISASSTKGNSGWTIGLKVNGKNISVGGIRYIGFGATEERNRAVSTGQSAAEWYWNGSYLKIKLCDGVSCKNGTCNLNSKDGLKLNISNWGDVEITGVTNVSLFALEQSFVAKFLKDYGAAVFCCKNKASGTSERICRAGGFQPQRPGCDKAISDFCKFVKYSDPACGCLIKPYGTLGLMYEKMLKDSVISPHVKKCFVPGCISESAYQSSGTKQVLGECPHICANIINTKAGAYSEIDARGIKQTLACHDGMPSITESKPTHIDVPDKPTPEDPDDHPPPPPLNPIPDPDPSPGPAPTPAPFPAPIPDDPSDSKAHSNTLLIVGASIGVVLLLIGSVFVARYMWKKSRI